MTYGIKEVFLRSAMGIVAGDAGLGTRFDSHVGIGEFFGTLLVTLGAKLSA
jgi:hypothetical protein